MTPKAKRLLEWLERVPDHTLLERQVIASGLSRALDELLLAKRVTMTAHPSVKVRGPVGDYPAAAVTVNPPGE